MNEQVVEIEADSLAEAGKALHRDDLVVLQETVLSRGHVGTVEAIADTVDEAVIEAKSKFPAEAELEAQKTLTEPQRVVLRVKGDDEESARKAITPKKAEIIVSISLYRKGRKGFLGFFKSSNVYEVVVFQQAIVEVRFREKARLRAKVRSYLAKDLLQNVQELRLKNATWTEALQELNPKNDVDIRENLAGPQGLHLFDLLEALNIIENVCRKNEEANWRIAIEEAHGETLSARRELWIELRELDVEIADTFMFYTSLEGSAKRHKEPTGIPMYTRKSYGSDPPDKRYRETIPYYSTDEEAFSQLQERLKEFIDYAHYKQFLDAAGQDEATATLKHKCVAILAARKLRLKSKG